MEKKKAAVKTSDDEDGDVKDDVRYFTWVSLMECIRRDHNMSLQKMLRILHLLWPMAKPP